MALCVKVSSGLINGVSNGFTALLMFLASTGETPMFCGGLLPYPSGTFQSPGIQLPYYHCLWLMTASSSNEHLILFNYKRLHLDKANDSLQVFSLRNNSEWELSMLQLSGRCNNGEPTCPCNDTVTFLAHRFYAIFSSDNGTDSFEISYSSLSKVKQFIELVFGVMLSLVL